MSNRRNLKAALAHQRQEARRLARQRESRALPRPPERPRFTVRFKSIDTVALIIAFMLAAAGMTVENTTVLIGFWSAAGMALCAAVSAHHDLSRLARGAGCLVIATAIGIFLWYMAGINLEKELRQNYGRLFPSDNVDIQSACEGPPGAIEIIVGTNVFFAARFPFTMVSIDGHPLFIIDRDSKGALVLSFVRLFDDRNDGVVKIDKNAFWISPSITKTLSEKKDDLLVMDHNDAEILHLRFWNPKTVIFSGVFRLQGATVRATDEAISSSPSSVMSSLTHDCFGNERFGVEQGISFWRNGPSASDDIY